ncbi:MAG: bifunctional phosphopantothenoylcysteine decarboxylase/phosphopantothenate--cysteine ligase CoaBC [Candidatus Midichloria sp.]|nr:MAG: bifunctional phosphopantothenoylcysteine decarboxylase/phosphopantothenate--cysteine ligase CoaBC [Candidatus Midichloria sp.]
MKNIILGISGSIAAYKAIELAKLLINTNSNINIVLSKSATGFISPLTLKSLLPKKVFLADETLDDNDQMLHINLAKKADLILIAPCAANMIANLANGAASCLLTSLCLATKAKIIIAPAMNVVMWENSIVQANIKKLKEHGILVIYPTSGKQACSDNGIGRMSEPRDILEYISCVDFISHNILKGKKIVITAGPTQEKIDPVKFISNYSSGKMGYSLAKAAQMLGATVTLISGSTSLNQPKNIEFIGVSSAQEMFKAAQKHAVNCNIFISAAAVADYKPKSISLEKIKKGATVLNLELEKNPDIIYEIKSQFPHIFCLGFAAETTNHLEYGYQKLKTKNLDAIAINDVSTGKIFNEDYNELKVITKSSTEFLIAKKTKLEVAFELLYALFK